MSRLSDRAFLTIKKWIESRYSNSPADQSERMLLLARLQVLRAQPGPPMTSVQLWEALCDVVPNIDRTLLKKATTTEVDVCSVILGASTSVGVGGMTAVLMAAAVGLDPLSVQGVSINPEGNSAASEAHSAVDMRQYGRAGRTVSGSTVATNTIIQQHSPAPVRFTSASPASAENMAIQQPQTSALAMAKSLGWQAALKSQNAPHSAQHWAETAILWQQALAYLDRIPVQDSDYGTAQAKKAQYRQNLRQVEARQLAAQQSAQSIAAALIPRVSQSVGTAANHFSGSTSAPAVSQPISPGTTTSPGPNRPETDFLAVAKRHGWQAAVASQNAPHPPEKWANISRLWQVALQHLEKIDAQHPDYVEAQQVKADYENNLAIIRQRYQQAQSAHQRLQSLEASLAEIDKAAMPTVTRYKQLFAIDEQLQTISSATLAYQQAQPLIVQTRDRLNAIANHPDNAVLLSSTD
ncbi:MAG: hypothetical protein HC800_01045 [Phormidesmis sp. RL_2_1]|nr:hypothetical protein [Phormidesmis sp. RL_2_1]